MIEKLERWEEDDVGNHIRAIEKINEIIEYLFPGGGELNEEEFRKLMVDTFNKIGELENEN